MLLHSTESLASSSFDHHHLLHLINNNNNNSGGQHWSTTVANYLQNQFDSNIVCTPASETNSEEQDDEDYCHFDQTTAVDVKYCRRTSFASSSLDTPLSGSLDSLIVDDLFKSDQTSTMKRRIDADQQNSAVSTPMQQADTIADEQPNRQFDDYYDQSSSTVVVDRDLDRLIDRMLEVQPIPLNHNTNSGYTLSTESTIAPSPITSSVTFAVSSLSSSSLTTNSSNNRGTFSMDYKPLGMHHHHHIGLHAVKSEPIVPTMMNASMIGAAAAAAAAAQSNNINEFFTSMSNSASAYPHFFSGFELPSRAAHQQFIGNNNNPSEMFRSYSSSNSSSDLSGATGSSFMPPPPVIVSSSTTQHHHCLIGHHHPSHHLLVDTSAGASSSFGNNIYHPMPTHQQLTSDIDQLHRRGSSSSTTPSPLLQQLSPTFTSSIQQQRFSSAVTSSDSSSLYDTAESTAMQLAMSSISGATADTTTNTTTNSSDVDSSNDKLCAVCSDRAVCQHYGARTCEGCKGFFKRTVQKKAQYVCAGNRNCPIDKRYRSRCQYCRYQKCLGVGMVKEVVRYGSLQGRRGRLPSKAKYQQSDDPSSPPIPLITAIVRAYYESSSSGVVHHHQHHSSDNETNFIDTTISITHLIDHLESSYMAISGFAMKIPGVQAMPSDDLHALLNLNFFSLMSLRIAYRSINCDVDELVFDDGQLVSIRAMPECSRRFMEAIRIEASNMKKTKDQVLVDWDNSSIACLLAVILFSYQDSWSVQLIDRAMIDRLQNSIMNALRDHYSTQHVQLANVMSQVTRFQRIQSIGIDMLRECDDYGNKLGDAMRVVLGYSRRLQLVPHH